MTGQSTEPQAGEPIVDRIAFEDHAERIRASRAFGRAAPVKRLFEYLLQRSLTGPPPKELEVAEAVFGRTHSNRAHDSTTRVYIHRLRQKLDEYYQGAGRTETYRFALPKGAYRLTLVRVDEAAQAVEGEAQDEADAPSAARLRVPIDRRWMLAGLAGLGVASVATTTFVSLAMTKSSFSHVRRSPAWSGLFSNGRPITVVIGDYYIFGEMDEHANVSRLIREYAVNSPNDLANMQMDDPVLISRYANLDLYYLPVSVSSTLRNLMPVLATTPGERDRIRIVTTSALTPDILKTTNIVYVGYLSGLGLLREPVFAGSRFRVGETYDVLIDQKTGRSYASQEGGPQPNNESRRDYGYVSTFDIPNGNKMLIVAGARDVGLVQMSEVLTTPQGLRPIADKAGKSRNFEALYEVEAISRVNLRDRLIVLSPLEKDKIWETGIRYPLR